MSFQTVTIQLPNTIYRRLERLADRQNRSVANVVTNAVERIEPFADLPEDEVQELDALAYLSDDSLWGLAQRVLTTEQQAEWEHLNEKLGRFGRISSTEETQRQELLALYDYVVLHRAIALQILQQRGHDVAPLLTIPSA